MPRDPYQCVYQGTMAMGTVVAALASGTIEEFLLLRNQWSASLHMIVTILYVSVLLLNLYAAVGTRTRVGKAFFVVTSPIGFYVSVVGVANMENRVRAGLGRGWRFTGERLPANMRLAFLIAGSVWLIVIGIAVIRILRKRKRAGEPVQRI